MSSELASMIEANTRIDGCSFPTPIPGLHVSLFVAYASGSRCAVSNSRHRGPGKQAAHVGRRGFHLRPRPLLGGFTRSTGLWKSHGGLESKAIPRHELGPRRKTDTVASDLRQDPTSDEA
jgi:hypothetical protein